MYSLLIVDDECIITDLLCDFIQRRKEGELEVAKAYSSKNAIHFMRENRVDILLTDINMPVTDGIALQKEALEINPDCKVIFLTGYDNFQHIQYALRHKSVDFILKTESNDIILQSVNKAIQMLDNEINADRLSQQAQARLKLSLPLLFEKLTIDLIEGEKVDFQHLQDTSSPLNVAKKILVLYGKPDNAFLMTKKNLFEFKNVVDQVIEKECGVFSLVYGINLLWLIQTERLDEPNTRKVVQSFMVTAQRLCMEMYHVSLSMVMSEHFVSLTELPVTLREMKQTVQQSAGLGSGLLLVENSALNERVDSFGRIRSAEWFELKHLLQNVVLSIESMQKDIFGECFTELVERVTQYHLRQSEIDELYLHIYLALLANANDNGFDMEEHGGVWSRLNAASIKMAAEVFFSIQRQTHFKNSNFILGNLKRYINNNIGGDLSLTKLSEYCHFNATYLSRLFKQMTGESLSEYISRQRYRRAADLLSNSALKIAAISAMLGFETPSYFTRFFKRLSPNSMSPQEYRDSTKK